MSGILDNKSRVIDAILTFEGRRQMAAGNFSVKYATFSDKNLVYQSDLEEGHVDPTTKIYLESFNSPCDEIIFVADDSGNLTPFRQHSEFGHETIVGNITSSLSWNSFVGGKIQSRLQIYYSHKDVSGSNFSEEPLYGANFASQIEGLLTSSIDNFSSLQSIGSIDPLFQDENFAISNNEIKFNILPSVENISMTSPTSVNTIDSLFSDKRLRNLDNFKYLPPIKKTNSVDKTDINLLISKNLLLGNYPPWGPTEKLSFQDIMSELSNYEDNSSVLSFDPTSKDNDIIAQFFEITNNAARKLDVIDYGQISDNLSNSLSSQYHVFFIGKVVVDATGADCFINLFTLLFGSNEEL